jgi:hypothetical protein
MDEKNPIEVDMPNNLPEVCCEKTYTHPAHKWIHYDIDNNVHERVWCSGDFLTVSRDKSDNK